MISSSQERTLLRRKIREKFLAAITEKCNSFHFGLFYGYVGALRAIGFITITQYVALTTACNERRWAKVEERERKKED